MNTCTIRIIDTTEKFVAIGEQWQQLSDEPFNSFSWNYHWWLQFGRDYQLRIFSLFDECNELVGIAPFFVDHWMGQSRLRFLGSGSTCTDYADLVVKDRYRDEFLRAIVEDTKATGIKMVELEGVTTKHVTDMCQQLGDNGFWKYECVLDSSWLLDLPESWESFCSGAKKGLRRKIKKAEKRFNAGEVIVVSSQDSGDFSGAFGTLVDLHQKRFVSKGEAGVFADESFTQFLRQATAELHQRNKAEIVIALTEGQPFAAQLYLLADSGPQLYQAGVDPEMMKLEPGHLMFTFTVQKAIAQGKSVFDFLRGSEAYKPYWGAQERRLSKIRCVSRKVIPSTMNHTYQFLRGVKTLYEQFPSNRG